MIGINSKKAVFTPMLQIPNMIQNHPHTIPPLFESHHHRSQSLPTFFQQRLLFRGSLTRVFHCTGTQPVIHSFACRFKNHAVFKRRNCCHPRSRRRQVGPLILHNVMRINASIQLLIRPKLGFRLWSSIDCHCDFRRSSNHHDCYRFSRTLPS